MSFRKQLEDLLDKYESEEGLPMTLTEYLTTCVEAFNLDVRVEDQRPGVLA